MVPTAPFLGFNGLLEQLIELRKTVYLLDDRFTRKYATQEFRGQAVRWWGGVGIQSILAHSKELCSPAPPRSHQHPSLAVLWRLYYVGSVDEIIGHW